MNGDKQIQRDVISELEREPELNSAAIGVTVADGVVTLHGHVSSFMEQTAAENAARRVAGVRAIAQEIDVRMDDETFCDEESMATEIANVLTPRVRAPKDGVRVRVDKGWVTLQGETSWSGERNHVERVVRCLDGVTGVSNLITVRSALINNLAMNARRALNSLARLCSSVR